MEIVELVSMSDQHILSMYISSVHVRATYVQVQDWCACSNACSSVVRSPACNVSCKADTMQKQAKARGTMDTNPHPSSVRRRQYLT